MHHVDLQISLRDGTPALLSVSVSAARVADDGHPLDVREAVLVSMIAGGLAAHLPEWLVGSKVKNAHVRGPNEPAPAIEE